MKWKVFIILVMFSVAENWTGFSSVQDNPAKDGPDKLRLIQFVFRHGDRTPLRSYKNDPYKQSDFVEGMGQLTIRGKKRMYELGKRLQERYQPYLDETKVKNVNARSSPRRRCLESCSLVLAGMFPPRPHEIWDDAPGSLGQLWQPIAIETVEKSRDTLLYPEAECPIATQEEIKMLDTPAVRTFLEENADFIANLTHYTGTNFSHWLEIGYLYNTLVVQQEYFGSSFKKPDWIDEMGNDTMKRLKNFHDLEFSVFDSAKSYLRLRAGSILKQLVSNMNETVDRIKSDHSENQVYLFSTHDTQLAYMLSALGIPQGQPTYGSGLIFELWQDADRNQMPHVRILYVNGTDNFSYQPLRLNKTRLAEMAGADGCDQFCRIDLFQRYLHDYFPGQIGQECVIS